MFSSVRRIHYDNSYSFYKDDGFRNEIKYTLTQYEYFKLRDYCAGFMESDINAGIDGVYTVKSYYFDTLSYDDYIEKQNGVYERKKYRIRTYGDLGEYRLEKKIKIGSLNKKISGEICMSDADMLISGYTDIITGNERTDSIISELYIKGYRNSVYIEYERQAFILKELDLRITFDKDLSAVYGNYGLRETMPAAIPIFYDGETIMEIKYKDFLPGWLERAIYNIAPSEFSISKYEEALKYILG